LLFFFEVAFLVTFLVIDAIALRALSYIIYLNEHQQYETIIERIGIPTIKLLDTCVAARAVRTVREETADSPPGPGWRTCV
jgi:hypothetical protein